MKEKIITTQYGEILISKLSRMKFKIWRVTFLKGFYHQNGMDFWFSENNGHIKCASR